MTARLLLAVVSGDGSRLDALPDGARVIAAAGFAAIVGKAPAGGLHGLDRAALAPLLLLQQRAGESALRQGAVLPVSFGAIAENAEHVISILFDGQGVLAAGLTAIGKKVEVQLGLRWDVQAAVRACLAANPGLAAQLAPNAPPGDRQAAGAELMGLVHAMRDQIGQTVLTALAPIITDQILSAPSAPETVLDVALLVEKSALPRLDATLDALDRQLPATLAPAMRLVGPMAPQSFTCLHVNLPTPAALAQARAALGLPENASMDAVRPAYLNLARALHPDVAGPDGAEAMAAIASAYRVLNEPPGALSLRRRAEG